MAPPVLTTVSPVRLLRGDPYGQRSFAARWGTRDIATDPLEGYLPAPGKATSTLALRYVLQEGKAVDRFPGKTDEEALAIIAAEQTAQEPESPSLRKIITKLAFMNHFTMEELTAIYTAAKTKVMIEVFLDKLKLAEEVNLTDPQIIGGLQALAASGLLTKERVQEALT